MPNANTIWSEQLRSMKPLYTVMPIMNLQFKIIQPYYADRERL